MKLTSQGLLVREPPDQLGLGENMAFHGTLKFGFAGSGLEIRFPVQRIEFEEVTVRATLGRARPIIANLAEIIPALPRSIGKLEILRDTLL